MPFDFAPTERTRTLRLARRGSLVLDNAEGTVIAVDRGCLWVTLENDPRDVVLVRGMRFEVDRSGRTVVVAEEDSTVRLTPAPTVVDRMVDTLGPPAKKLWTRLTEGLLREATRRRVPYF